MHTIPLTPIAALLLLLLLPLAHSATDIAPLSGLELNTTTPTQDYIDENKRQYAAYVANYELQLDAFKSAYEQQIKTVNQQAALIEAKLQELAAYLNPLEVLSALTKHCVQKYRVELVSVQTIQASLTSCISTASSAWSSLVASADTTRRTLISYINSNLNSGLNDCQSKFNKTNMNYTLCVTKVIGVASTYTTNNRKTFNTQLQSAKCSGATRIEAMVECGFSALYDGITTVGAVKRSIDNCVAQLAECATCHTQCEQLQTTAHRLPYNATRPNPFYDSNSTAPCAVVRYDFTWE